MTPPLSPPVSFAIACFFRKCFFLTDPPFPNRLPMTSPRPVPVPLLPEIFDKILSYLPVLPRFHLAVAFRRTFIRNQCLPYIPEASINKASAKGQVDLLQLWFESGRDLVYDKEAIIVASQRGHVNVLRWFQSRGLKWDFEDTRVMDLASEYGHVDVLEFWKCSGARLCYKARAMDYASARGHIAVLTWWKNSSLELKYSTFALDWASSAGRVNVLQWWRESGLALLYTSDAVDLASAEGNVNVLDWWKASNLVLKYTESAMDDASSLGKLAVLEWWAGSRYVLKYTENAMDLATDIEVLTWWKTSGLELLYSADVDFSSCADLHIVEWWKTSGLLNCPEQRTTP